MKRAHQGYLFEPLTLVERIRLVTYRRCRQVLDDPKSTRSLIESAIEVCDQMVKELPA